MKVPRDRLQGRVPIYAHFCENFSQGNKLFPCVPRWHVGIEGFKVQFSDNPFRAYAGINEISRHNVGYGAGAGFFQVPAAKENGAYFAIYFEQSLYGITYRLR